MNSRGYKGLLGGLANPSQGVPRVVARGLKVIGGRPELAEGNFPGSRAAEFKERSIRVNTLSPGVTDTRMLDSQSSRLGKRESVAGMYLSMIPLGRFALTEEIASAAVLLASDQSSYTTGADLMANFGVGQV